MTDSGSHTLSPIERCPNEVLVRIEQQLRSMLDPYREATSQMVAFRLTSRRLNSFFTQFAITHLSFFCKINWEKERNPVSYRNYAAVTKPLPAPDVFVPFITSLRIDFDRINGIPANYDPQEVVERFSLLWDEIGRYTSLSSISMGWGSAWGSVGKDVLYGCLATRLVQVVQQTTAGRPSQLHWTMPLDLHNKVPIHQALQTFTNLDMLEIYVVMDDAGERDPLNSLLGGVEELFSPELGELALETLYIQGTFPSMTSDDRVGVSPLQPFPSPGLPAMRNLKHITICFGMQPPRAVIDLDRLWVALKASGTCLMTISLDYGISDSLMEYLCSYEGLVEGRFNSRVPRTDKSLPSHSFAQVLSSHASSLTKLATVPNNGWLLADSYREEMALDPAMWPAPFLFLQLKSLLVAPPHNQEINVRNLQSLLDYTSEMPVLEALSINWSYELPFEQDLEHIWSRVSIKRSRLKELSIVVRNSFVVACATWAIEFPPLKEDMPNMRFKLKRFSPESGDREDSDSSS